MPLDTVVKDGKKSEGRCQPAEHQDAKMNEERWDAAEEEVDGDDEGSMPNAEIWGVGAETDGCLACGQCVERLLTMSRVTKSPSHVGSCNPRHQDMLLLKSDQ